MFQHVLFDGTALQVPGIQDRRPFRRLRGAAVQLSEQVVHVFGDEVHHVGLYRLPGGIGCSFAHCGLKPAGVAAPLVSDAANEGGRVVLHLAGQGVVQVFACPGDRRGRADVGTGRHHRKVGGGGDERSSGTGPGPAGRNVYRHRDRRLQQQFHDLPRGSEQAAWGVKLNHQEGGVLLRGLFDGPGDETLFYRVYHAVHRNNQRIRLRRCLRFRSARGGANQPGHEQ